jgi:RHS repeat-associated protein
MKKTFLVSLCMLLGLFVSTTFAVEVTVLGPNQYLRTSGAPDVYTDTFSAIPGEGKLIIKNGAGDGERRITDAISSAVILVNGVQIFGPSDFNQNVYLLESPVNLADSNSISVELASSPGSYLIIEVREEVDPPTVTFSADPETIMVGESSTLIWSSTNADSCVIEPGIGNVGVSGSITVSPTETTTYTITATGLGGTAMASVTVVVTYPPPTVSISADPGTIMVGESSMLTWSSTSADTCVIEPGIGPVDPNGSISVSPTETTTYSITATGLGGTASAQVLVTVEAAVEPQPEGSFGEQYDDLIPPDAMVESYDPKRFSLITGLVQNLDELPIADVSVNILEHPEYGTAPTDTEGRFSIPVEGGGTITVVYQKDGLITAHRKVYVPWNDIAIAETIVMIVEDPASTTLTFDGYPDTVVTHQSTEVTDEFGSRSSTTVFTGDNHAYEVDAQGNVIQELTTITTRATEYTTPESMPAILPPNSAYTYCVELGVDEAQRVRFENPVITWVDNFLGFDVGEIVPVGYYDRDKGVWVPSDNGVVVKLLDTDFDGIVDALDANGDDLPDDLNDNGSFSDEVTGLNDAQKYPPGSTFWRVAVTHFTPWDCNWPYGPPTDATSPNTVVPSDTDQQNIGGNGCPVQISSFVEERSRIFHEDIPIPGTDMTLHYGSNRVEGHKAFISVPASGDTVPASLKRIIVKVEVAGRTLEQILDPLPNQRAEFIWDRLDHLGRQVSCATTAHVSVGFEYDLVYYSASSDFIQAFAQVGDNPTYISARQGLSYWKRSVVHLEGRISAIAEGWTISSHHHLSPMDPSFLHKGDGTLNKNNAKIITTIAGNGTYGYSGDGGPATDAALYNPHGVAVDAVGNIYIADWINHRIRKVDTSGIITTVAGNGTEGYSGDGGPATEAALNRPACLDVDATGNLYIADQNNHRVRKVDTSGIITTVAGNGVQGYSGDDGPATEAEMNLPVGVDVDALGNLYIVEHYGHRIRKVDAGGIITTVAGTGNGGYNGDGISATEARIFFPEDVVLDDAGNLYIADFINDRIRKVDTSGIITTVAGNGTGGYSGDGGPATEAMLQGPAGVELDSAGNLYIACFQGNRIRKVDTSGIITTVAGNGVQGYNGDDGPATEAELNWAAETAMDAAGNLYIADYTNHRIRKVALPKAFAQFVVTGDISFVEENGLGHILSSAGLHLRTIDLATGIVLREFGYDQDNNLVSITDQFGNQITIQRDGSGVPTVIVSSDGITTGLTIDTNNHLTRITYPGGNYYDFEYTPDGLMTAEIEPEENRFDHVFDSIGRLTDVTDQEGGHWHYTRYIYENGDILNEALTGEGNLTSYLDHTFTTGAFTSTITGPVGAETQFAQSSDGLTVNKSLPCGMELEFKYGVDPEYKFKFVKEMTEASPLGLEKVTLRDKTYQDTNTDDIPDLITDTVTVNGKGTTLVNNVLQSQKTITSPVGRTVTTFYDPATLLTTSLAIPGLYDTAYGYNTEGRLTSIDTNTRGTDFTYNAQGFLETITDPENHTFTYTYDPVGRVKQVDRPDNTSVWFTYDKNGNMTVLTNPSVKNHVFGYNSVNLNSSYLTLLSGSYSYVYDNDRRLIQTNFPSGNQINNIYDTTRLVQIQTPEGNIDFTYLCGTKVGSIAKGGESITFGYDGNLVTSDTLAGTLNQTLGYSYNNDFNLNGFTYAGVTANYVYDNDGLLTGAGSFAITRNAQNGLPEVVSGGSLDLSRSFNGYGEVSDEDYTVNGQGITSWNLTRDNNGRIVQKAETVAGTTSNYVYTYDPMGRLRTVTKDSTLVEEYQYDPNGTRIDEMNALRGVAGRSFTYSDEDHLLTAGTDVYQYDVDGFLSSKTDGTDITQYDYSSRGELLVVTLPDGRIIEYIHDPLGRRIVKKVGGITVEKYLWQGLTRLLAVYDGSDNLLMRFEYADSRMPVAMTSGSSTYYLTYNQVGSLRNVADAAGNVIKNIDYDSFGNIISDSDPSFEVPFGFAGGLHDRDTGLVRFGFRDYDPDVGRWTAKDPIMFAGGDTDLYGYCLSDPVNLVDPDGLIVEADPFDISLSAGAWLSNPAHPGAILGATITGLKWGVETNNPFGGVVVGGATLVGSCIGCHIALDIIFPETDSSTDPTNESSKPCKLR